MAPADRPLSEPWRILVIANETAASEALRAVIALRAGAGAEVVVVAPALSSRLAYWSSAGDDARAAATVRLAACLQALEELGIEASGWVGDAEPLLAIDDALCTFAADELIVATHPEGRSTWLTRNIVERARHRVRLPIHHVVVDEVGALVAA
jgi:hypothetical protein